METEIWKDIDGYNGVYKVSTFGNVKSFNKNREIILTPFPDTRGYLRVRLYSGKKTKDFPIHQLVAVAFLNHVVDGMNTVVNHINNNKLFNYASNLESTTQRDNASKFKSSTNCTSTHTGVSFDKRREKWVSRIYINGTYKFLGYFLNEEDASIAYQNKLKSIA